MLRCHFKFICVFLIYGIEFFIIGCSGHGRLIEPPSRASAWRYGFSTPPNYNDHELYCGGFTRQWKKNGGKCGECGDAYDLPSPRPNEHGGQYGQGVIVRKYASKSEITIRVELTASHMGYFEFRLCEKPSGKQECFDKNLLHVLGGSPSHTEPNDLNTRFYPRNGSRIYEIKALLPDLQCNQCVLQWRYIAGNNWGICADGNGAVGCGPQEEFRACSDISLNASSTQPFTPRFPATIRPSVDTQIPTSSTPFTDTIYFTLLIFIIVCLLIALLMFLAWHLYIKDQQNLKNQFINIKNVICKKRNINYDSKSSLPTSKSVDSKVSNYSRNTPPTIPPPIPPPRSKRQTQTTR